MSKRKLDEVFAVEAELCEELGSGSESSCSTDRSDQDGKKSNNNNNNNGGPKGRRRKSKPSLGGLMEDEEQLGDGPGGAGRGHPRTAANARERDRTHSVNSAFTILRDKIPTEPKNRKLSKIETLRLATSYISHLATVLRVGNEELEQPCMHMTMVSRQGHEDMPRIICTFCLSHTRSSSSSSAKGAPMRSGQRHAINPMNDMNGMVHHHPHMHPAHHHHHHHHQQTAAMMR